MARVWRHGWAGFAPGFRVWSLLLAILPTLTFLGHWGLNIDIPGTDLYVTIIPGETGADGHTQSHGPAGQQSHEQHCHAGVATCSDIPFTGASPFALLTDSLAKLGAAGALVALALLFWRPGRTASVGPELQPPRPRFAFA